MGSPISAGTVQAWAALGADSSLLDRVSYGGPSGGLPARLPVLELARATVAVCSLAASELVSVRTGRPAPRVRVDDEAVATAFLSDRLVRVDGQAWSTFAPLSRFWRASDGWVRTHANYPHHRARLLAALGVPGDCGDAVVDAVAGAIAERTALEVEETVYAAGGLAVAARGPEEWARSEQGALAAGQPLLTTARVDDAPVRVLGDAALPCAGLRVLDLTRVLAGPVATRTLALLGADVLRIDAPHLPESQEAHNDTGMGKRSTTLDLGDATGRRVFEELLDDADVVVTGYRPGALERFGLTPEALAGRRPGLVIAQLSAWGRYGPWHERRGFDSLVQVATGIAELEGSPDSPGALPAQALDHGTGYLLAAGVLRALTEQHRTGGTRLVRLALAQTAHWLVHGLAPAPGDDDGFHAERRMSETDSPMGLLRYALPPVSYEGGPADWARPPGLWGTDAPVWSGS
ncbi:L-carnitine dehydratase/bile acid-inducible protein F [Streptomyces viridochromogenes DSM 40736]|uniref:L-carnitine dehydratase/bile acid-inducible protein F n=1 Tax=Streptomyces viridochromogenes (strain DSM 40736 / JCM 4977 / BCRC 1201 / Tue 494) TaxID=591159 RepID=D9XGC2_STRVT|nr:CoA transferase [Streptomyces viridochromogenes]EFL37011.1 L-carnitine dehydratase/bile acid-inducible protein F [Streptomyces viridochromogenes DSM 40736]